MTSHIQFSMKRLSLLIFLFLISVGIDGVAKDPKEPKPEEIIKSFAAKESAFRDVWEKYTYIQDLYIEVLDDRGEAREKRSIRLEIYFTSDGEKQYRILSDEGELRSVGLTDEDLHDAIFIQPFALTTEEIDEYEIKPEGKEQVDEIDTYVFDVKPRKIKKGKRYFEGRIWVDDLDLQIVRTLGKAVPDYANNKFPEFETIRQQIDGEYWFPVWTKADDKLVFGSFYNRRSVHIREWITYKEFRKFEVDTTIKYGEVKPD